MVKHVILWQIKDEYSAEEKLKIAADAKKALEALKGNIDGLLDIKVITKKLPSSNADMMLDSSFVDEAALKGYAIHPLHVAAADNFVRPFVSTRLCLDF